MPIVLIGETEEAVEDVEEGEIYLDCDKCGASSFITPKDLLSHGDECPYSEEVIKDG